MSGLSIFTGTWIKYNAEDVANALDERVCADPGFNSDDYEMWISPKDFSQFEKKYNDFYYKDYPEKGFHPPVPKSILIGKDWEEYSQPGISEVKFKVFDLSIIICSSLHDGEFLLMHKSIRPLINELNIRSFKEGWSRCAYRNHILKQIDLKQDEKFQKMYVSEVPKRDPIPLDFSILSTEELVIMRFKLKEYSEDAVHLKACDDEIRKRSVKRNE